MANLNQDTMLLEWEALLVIAWLVHCWFKCCISAEGKTVIPVNKNINSLFIHKSCGKMAVWEKVGLELLWFTSGWALVLCAF